MSKAKNTLQKLENDSNINSLNFQKVNQNKVQTQEFFTNYLQNLAKLDIINQNEHTGRTPLENLLNNLKSEFGLGNIAITYEIDTYSFANFVKNLHILIYDQTLFQTR
jgi:hypothetical protein